MKDTPKDPVEKPDPKAFERMTEFTRRLVAVPKSELPVKGPTKERKRGS
jgi:hypothetical protein